MTAAPLVSTEGLERYPPAGGITGSTISDALNSPLVEYSRYSTLATDNVAEVGLGEYTVVNYI